MVTTTKALAAVRQLDVAIDLLFADRDPLAIRTLIAAAAGILGDLVDKKAPGTAWRTRMIEDSGLTPKAAREVLNSAQNFLKHADRDPEGTLSFEEEENDHVLFMATLECGELGQRQSMRMQAFQIWYLAAYPSRIGHDTDPVKKSKKLLPGLDALARQEQMARGAAFVHEIETNAPDKYNA